MKLSALFLTASISLLMLGACATDDPRGYHPVEIGNTTNQSQMVREGRDTQTYTNTKMPTPRESGSQYSGEMPEAKMHGPYEDVEVDDKIDFNKI